MNKSIRNKLFFVAVLIAITLFFFIRQSTSSSRLAKNHTVVCGSIIHTIPGKSLGITYTFTFEGKSYEFNHSSSKAVYENYKKGLVAILIAVEKRNPKNHQILFFSEDFNDLKISKSDTLNVRCN